MSQPIRILQLLSEASFGGTEQVVYDVVIRMNPKSFANDLCFLLGPGPVGNLYKTRGFQVNHLYWHIWKTPVTLLQFYKLLKREHYQIIHAYGFKANLMARVIGKLAGVPQIISGLHSQYPSVKKHRLFFWFDRLTLPLTTYYVAVSRAAVNYLKSQGYPSFKFRVIYNGIDPTAFTRFNGDRYSLRKRYKLPTNKVPIIVCVARFRLGKGQETLLAALARLPTQNYRCLLVGDGPQRQSVEHLAEELNLGDRVKFMGARDHDEIAQILQLADIFVLPSLWEGMPMAIMEAMAAGLPVIATDVGGTGELVVQGETGLLVRAGDVVGLAREIARLLDDPELRRHLGARGRERITREFSLDKTVREYEALYEELAER